MTTISFWPIQKDKNSLYEKLLAKDKSVFIHHKIFKFCIFAAFANNEYNVKWLFYLPLNQITMIVMLILTSIKNLEHRNTE